MTVLSIKLGFTEDRYSKNFLERIQKPIFKLAAKDNSNPSMTNKGKL